MNEDEEDKAEQRQRRDTDKDDEDWAMLVQLAWSAHRLPELAYHTVAVN